MKSTSLSMSGVTGSMADNRDGTHETSVIHVKDASMGITGQLSLMIPKGEKGDGGLEPGEYSVSVSLTRKSEQVKADAQKPATSRVRGEA